MATTAYDVVPFQGRFPSWEAFERARQAHCEKTYAMYVCRNTVKVAVANKRRKLQVPDTWVFDRKVYVCTHGYKRVSRSSGSRPRQNVRYTDCKARFTACVASEQLGEGREVFFIKVTGQHLVHNDHPLSLEQWRMYSQNRAAVIEHPYLAHEAELMQRVGSSKRAARAHIEALSGKVCTIKDMHNLYARLKKRDNNANSDETARSQSPTPTSGGLQELNGSQGMTSLPKNGRSGVRVEPVLEPFVKADVENHVSILSSDDGSYAAVCLSSRAMKEHFQVFPELMILDVSMATQMQLQPVQQLHGFLSMDALGNAKPVFLAQSPAMSSTLLHRVCQDFKRAHPMWMQMKVLVMNKLSPDAIQVLALEFPATRVLLCQIHVVQLLTDLLACPELPVRSQIADAQTGIPPSSTLDLEKVVKSLHQLVHSHSESHYEQVKADLARQLSVGNRRELLAVLDRTFEPYRALWVSYARAEQFDLSSIYTNGMHSFWEPMTNVFKRTGGDSLAIAAASRSLSATTTGTSHAEVLNATLLPVATAAGTRAVLPSNDARAMSVSRAVHGPELSTGNSLAQKTSEVLTTMKLVEHEWTSKMMMLELTKPVAVDRCDPLLHLMLNCLSGFAVGLVSSQLTVQSAHANGSVTVTKLRAGKASHVSTEVATGESTVRWLNKLTREKHILHQDGSACDCEFFALLQLPCRHLIWYEVVALQHKQLSLAAVGSRWLLRSFQTPRVASQRTSNEIEYHLL